VSSIRVRQTTYGPRYDVRYRTNGQQLTKSFKVRSDAAAFKRKIDGDELAGLVTNRRGRERLFGDYADAWLNSGLSRDAHSRPPPARGMQDCCDAI
jgi:hypothetical protein